MLTVISLLTTILNPFITNASGSYSNIVQASYSYGIGYFNIYENGSTSLDTHYYIDIDINIQGTYSGYIYINVTQPSSTMPSTYYPKYISIGGNYVGSGYSNAGITQFCFKITSSSHLYVRLYYGLGTLNQYYGLAQGTSQNLNWVNNGNQYVAVTSLSVSSFTKDDDLITYIDDIESAIETLKTYTDSIENYLLQIWNTSSNIYTTLTNISTNIASISNILNDINGKLDNLDSIEWLNMPSPSGNYLGYTTDFTTYDTSVGYKDGGYFVYESFRANDTNNYGIYKLRIPLGGFPYVFSDFKFYTRYNGNLNEWTINQYIIHINRDSFVLYFTLNDSYHNWPNGNNMFVIKTSKRFYKYSETTTEFKYILPDNKDYWSIYNTINQFSQLRKVNNSLENIISILGTSELSQNDQQNKTTTDNFFNQVLQNLNLPSFPDKDNQPMFPILQEFIGYYGQIVGNQHMSMYRWLLGLSSVFLILKVILL